MNRYETQPRRITLKKGAAIASTLALVGSLTGVASGAEASVQRPDTNGIFDLELGDYQTFPVKPGDILLGDFSVGPLGTSVGAFKQDAKAALDPTIPDNPNIVQLYDTKPDPSTGVDNRDTGQITVIDAYAFVYADGWKGAVAGNIPEDLQSSYVQSQTEAMKELGCINSCSGGVRVSEVTPNGVIPYGGTK